jgi:glycosyltransferase involved in cell wall biosynthesis
MKNKTIVCFTASYPYGNKETYFDNELKYLSESFENVFIVPLYNPNANRDQRIVFDNVKVFEPILAQGSRRIIKGLINFRWNGVYFKEFFNNKIYLDHFKFKKWLNSMLLYDAGINFFNDNVIPLDAFLYSYWAEIPFFSSKSLNSFKKVVRMHGGDFYLYRNRNYLPLRQEIYMSASLLLPISKDIREILINYYKIDKSTVLLSYLGVNNFATVCALKTSQQVIKFVSCSNIYGLKRVHLILSILLKMKSDTLIEWHHFGSGEGMSDLVTLIELNKKENITSVLYGHLEQKQMIEVYQSNYFDWFINVSEHEGLPVSIMEAFSYGIPAIATDVGGTSEIVNDDNGLLVDKDVNILELVERIQNLTNDKYLAKRNNAYVTWLNNFEADRNYVESTKNIMGINR